MTSMRSLVGPCPFLWVLVALVGCARPTLESRWRDRQIAVDGEDGEWRNAKMSVESGALGLGLMNDERRLYLTLSLTDRAIQGGILRQGFVVWLDPRGGKKKNLGIRFPLGMQETADRWDRKRDTQGTGTRAGGRGRGLSAHQLQAMFERSGEAPEMEILGPGKDRKHRIALAQSQDVRLKMGYANGRLVYEMSMPLASETGHAVGAAPGQMIGMGFEIWQLDLPVVRRAAGKRGWRGVAGTGGGSRASQRFRLWTRVQLASGPPPNQR